MKPYKMPFEQFQAQARGAREGMAKITEIMELGTEMHQRILDDANVPRPLFFKDDPVLDQLKPFFNEEQITVTHIPCGECKGTGQYVGFTAVEACKVCKGAKVVPNPDHAPDLMAQVEGFPAKNIDWPNLKKFTGKFIEAQEGS
jgi:hypothetical protein